MLTSKVPSAITAVCQCATSAVFLGKAQVDRSFRFLNHHDTRFMSQVSGAGAEHT